MPAAPAKGVTLVELLVALVIASILVASAVGPWAAAVTRAKVVTTTNALVEAVQSARSLAVMSGRGTAVICPADGDDCDIAADWNNGWLLFADLDRSGTRDENETISRRWQPPATPVTVTSNRIAISFTPDGYLSNAEGVLLVVCDTSGRNSPRSVRLWGLGAHSIYTPSNCDLP